MSSGLHKDAIRVARCHFQGRKCEHVVRIRRKATRDSRRDESTNIANSMIEIEFRYQPTERRNLMSVKRNTIDWTSYPLCSIRQPDLYVRRWLALINLHLDIPKRRNGRRRSRYIGEPARHGG